MWHCPPVVLCRAPDNPHQQIIKRLLAVEGDTILEDEDTGATVDITQVTALLPWLWLSYAQPAVTCCQPLLSSSLLWSLSRTAKSLWKHKPVRKLLTSMAVSNEGAPATCQQQ